MTADSARAKRSIRRIAHAALLAFATACAAREYAAEPIDATVVDGTTGQPIAGALVIARWIARGDGGTHRPRDLGSVRVLETITAPDGRFHFDGWGPVAYAGKGTLLDEDPLILVFKHGYQVSHASNGQYGVPPTKDFRAHKSGPLRSSLWNGETLSMKPYQGSEREFFAKVYHFFVVSDLWSMFAESTPCDWKQLPKTIEYVENEKRAYRSVASADDWARVASIRDQLVINDQFFVRKGCGSAREFFRSAR